MATATTQRLKPPQSAALINSSDNRPIVVLCSSKDDYTLSQDICKVCGSLGKGDEGNLIACSQCGQCYHPYCASIAGLKVVVSKGWRCLACTVCETCGQPGDEAKLLLCDECDISYHTYCLNPPLEDVPPGAWKCNWCVVCQKCKSPSPGVNSGWQKNYTECGPCASKSTCPKCHVDYSKDELIVSCKNCSRWLHASCDSINNEDECESAIELGYSCVLCRPKDEVPAYILQRRTSNPSANSGVVSNSVESESKNHDTDDIRHNSSLLNQRTNQSKVLPHSPRPQSAPISIVDNNNLLIKRPASSLHLSQNDENVDAIEEQMLKMDESNNDESAIIQGEKDLVSKIYHGLHEVDGVFLSETGLNYIKSQRPEPTKRQRAKRGSKIQKTDDCVVLDESIKDEDEECRPTNDKTDEDGKKKRVRKLSKAGIGGFSVRQRGVRVNKEDDMNRSLAKDEISMSANSNQNQTPSSPKVVQEQLVDLANSKPKRVRKKPKKKTNLVDQYPMYLQEAFFGKVLLSTDLKSNDDKQIELNDCKTTDLNSEHLHNSSPYKVTNKFSDMKNESIESFAASCRTDSQMNNKSDDLMDVFIGDSSITDESSENRRDFDADLLNPDFNLDMVGPLDSKDVEDLLNGLGNTNQHPVPSQSSVDQSASQPQIISPSFRTMPDTNSQYEHPSQHMMAPQTPSPRMQFNRSQMVPVPKVRQPLVDRMQSSDPYSMPPSTPRPMSGPQKSPFSPQSPYPHATVNMNTPNTPINPQISGEHSPMYPTNQTTQPMAPVSQVLRQPFAEPRTTQISHQPNQFSPQMRHPQPHTSNQQAPLNEPSKQSLIQILEAEEALGSMATKSAVLYANVEHPNIRQEYKSIEEREKQIRKLWRKLPNEERIPWNKRARANRSASKGATKSSNETSKKMDVAVQPHQRPPIPHENIPAGSQQVHMAPPTPMNQSQEMRWKQPMPVDNHPHRFAQSPHQFPHDPNSVPASMSPLVKPMNEAHFDPMSQQMVPPQTPSPQMQFSRPPIQPHSQIQVPRVRPASTPDQSRVQQVDPYSMPPSTPRPISCQQRSPFSPQSPYPIHPSGPASSTPPIAPRTPNDHPPIYPQAQHNAIMANQSHQQQLSEPHVGPMQQSGQYSQPRQPHYVTQRMSSPAPMQQYNQNIQPTMRSPMNVPQMRPQMQQSAYQQNQQYRQPTTVRYVSQHQDPQHASGPMAHTTTPQSNPQQRLQRPMVSTQLQPPSNPSPRMMVHQRMPHQNQMTTTNSHLAFQQPQAQVTHQPVLAQPMQSQASPNQTMQQPMHQQQIQPAPQSGTQQSINQSTAQQTHYSNIQPSIRLDADDQTPLLDDDAFTDEALKDIGNLDDLANFNILEFADPEPEKGASTSSGNQNLDLDADFEDFFDGDQLDEKRTAELHASTMQPQNIHVQHQPQQQMQHHHHHQQQQHLQQAQTQQQTTYSNIQPMQNHGFSEMQQAQSNVQHQTHNMGQQQHHHQQHQIQYSSPRQPQFVQQQQSQQQQSQQRVITPGNQPGQYVTNQPQMVRSQVPVRMQHPQQHMNYAQNRMPQPMQSTRFHSPVSHDMHAQQQQQQQQQHQHQHQLAQQQQPQHHMHQQQMQTMSHAPQSANPAQIQRVNQPPMQQQYNSQPAFDNQQPQQQQMHHQVHQRQNPNQQVAQQQMQYSHQVQQNMMYQQQQQQQQLQLGPQLNQPRRQFSSMQQQNPQQTFAYQQQPMIQHQQNYQQMPNQSMVKNPNDIMMHDKNPIVGDPMTMEFSMYEQGSGSTNEAINFPEANNQHENSSSGVLVSNSNNQDSVASQDNESLSQNDHSDRDQQRADISPERTRDPTSLANTNQDSEMVASNHIGRMSAGSNAQDHETIQGSNENRSSLNQSMQGQNQLLKQLLATCPAADGPGSECGSPSLVHDTNRLMSTKPIGGIPTISFQIETNNKTTPIMNQTNVGMPAQIRATTQVNSNLTPRPSIISTGTAPTSNFEIKTYNVGQQVQTGVNTSSNSISDINSRNMQTSVGTSSLPANSQMVDVDMSNCQTDRAVFNSQQPNTHKHESHVAGVHMVNQSSLLDSNNPGSHTGEVQVQATSKTSASRTSTEKQRKSDYMAKRRADLEKEPTPPPREAKPKKRVRGPNKRSRASCDNDEIKTIDSNSNTSEAGNANPGSQGATPRKRMRKSQKAKLDNENMLTSFAARLQTDLPGLDLQEPFVEVNNNVGSVFASGDLNSMSSRLRGQYGHGVPSTTSSNRTKTKRRIIGYYHEEFPVDLASVSVDSFGNKLLQLMLDRDCDTPGSIISGTTSDSDCNADVANHDVDRPGVQIITQLVKLDDSKSGRQVSEDDTDINNNDRCMSPSIPINISLPNSQVPLSDFVAMVREEHEDKENLDEAKAIGDFDKHVELPILPQSKNEQAETSLNMRLKDHGNVSVSLTLTEEEVDGVKRVLSKLPNLIDDVAQPTDSINGSSDLVCPRDEKNRLGGTLRLVTGKPEVYGSGTDELRFDETNYVPMLASDITPNHTDRSETDVEMADVKPDICCTCKAIVLDRGIRKATKEIPNERLKSSSLSIRNHAAELIFCSVDCYATCFSVSGAGAGSSGEVKLLKDDNKYSRSHLVDQCAKRKWNGILYTKWSPSFFEPSKTDSPVASDDIKDGLIMDSSTFTPSFSAHMMNHGDSSVDSNESDNSTSYSQSTNGKQGTSIDSPYHTLETPTSDNQLHERSAVKDIITPWPEGLDLLQVRPYKSSGSATLKSDDGQPMEIEKTPEFHEDVRRCVLCHELGDGESDGPARLLNLFIDGWVHLNCALWSLDVYELANGALMNVDLACRKAMSCSHCRRSGATLKCFKPRCPNYYHFVCALKEKCSFYEDKSVQCRQHAKSSVKEMTSFTVKRKVYVNRDEQRQVAEMIQSEQQSVMRLGGLVFLNIGQLLPHQLGTFHDQNNIFPVGYEVIRFYWSYRQFNKRCKYVCTIEDHEGRPRFRVVAQEFGHDDEEFIGDSPQIVWRPIIDMIVQLREQVPDTITIFPAYIRGEDLFGLTEPSIVRILESLPGVETLTDYEFKFGRSPLLELPLAINPSGCARTEPKLRTHFKRPYTIQTANNVQKSRLQSLSNSDSSSPYIKQFVHSKSSQYRKMKSEWRNNVVLARSRVQGLGLYAARDIEKHTMVIEYIGMLIRNEIAERYERIHEANNRGIYMFRLDEDRVIDATLAGGLARYINHSCNPNCVAEAVEIDRERKILIIANRKILKGEELGYDYKLAIEDDQHKISCLCGAATCKKWMN